MTKVPHFSWKVAGTTVLFGLLVGLEPASANDDLALARSESVPTASRQLVNAAKLPTPQGLMVYLQRDSVAAEGMYVYQGLVSVPANTPAESVLQVSFQDNRTQQLVPTTSAIVVSVTPGADAKFEFRVPQATMNTLSNRQLAINAHLTNEVGDKSNNVRALINKPLDLTVVDRVNNVKHSWSQDRLALSWYAPNYSSVDYVMRYRIFDGHGKKVKEITTLSVNTGFFQTNKLSPSITNTSIDKLGGSVTIVPIAARLVEGKPMWDDPVEGTPWTVSVK